MNEAKFVADALWRVLDRHALEIVAIAAGAVAVGARVREALTRRGLKRAHAQAEFEAKLDKLYEEYHAREQQAWRERRRDY